MHLIARRHKRPRSLEQGALLLWAMLLIAGISLASVRIFESVAFQEARTKEMNLLRDGREIVRAIERYYWRTPGGVPMFPATLSALESDKRFIGIERHLRRNKGDSMMPGQEWALIRANDGGISGVFSQSTKAPIRKSGFAPAEAGFDRAKSYKDWKFEFVPTKGGSKRGVERRP